MSSPRPVELVGVRLVVEVLERRPVSLGHAETVMLVALAESARDETRISLPGIERLCLLGKCSRRTAYRRIAALQEAGLIELADRGRTGHRASWRILSMPELPASMVAHSQAIEPASMVAHSEPQQPASMVAHSEPVDNAGLPATQGVRQLLAEFRVAAGQEPAKNGSTACQHVGTPPLNTPLNKTDLSVDDTSVEAETPVDNPEAERARQLAELEAFMASQED